MCGGYRLQLDHRGSGQRPAAGSDGVLVFPAAAGEDQGPGGPGPVELADGGGPEWPGQLIQAVQDRQDAPGAHQPRGGGGPVGGAGKGGVVLV